MASEDPAFDSSDWQRCGRGDGRRPLVIAAALTPFREGAIDLTGFEENLRFADAMGVDGVLLAGTTGSNERLRAADRLALVERAVQCLAEEVVRISGVSSGVPETIAEEAAGLRRAGVHAILVAPPVGASSPRDESAIAPWLERVVRLCDPMPVLFYHPPTFAAAPLAATTIAEIASVTGLRGVKDSTGLSRVLEHWLPHRGPQFAVFVGNARLFLRTRDSITGGVLALASVRPEEFCALARSHDPGDGVETLIAGIEEDLARFESGGLTALREMHEEIGLFGGDDPI